MARRIIIEAVACVTKYFVAASVDRGFFLLISMGIIASRLNSRPTHISIRLVLVPVPSVPSLDDLEMLRVSSDCYLVGACMH